MNTLNKLLEFILMSQFQFLASVLLYETCPKYQLCPIALALKENKSPWMTCSDTRATTPYKS